MQIAYHLAAIQPILTPNRERLILLAAQHIIIYIDAPPCEIETVYT